MKIWLLSSQKKLRGYDNSRFREEALKLGIKFRVVVPDNFEIMANVEPNESISYNSKPIKLPDVFIPRYAIKYFSSAIVRQFEKTKTLVLNTTDARELAKDKMACLQQLACFNLPIPKTILAKLPLDIEFIEANLKYPIIIKRTEGSEGKGIILCENRTQLEDIFELIAGQMTMDPSFNIILQEFITSSFGKDVRVFVVGGRAVGAMLRQGKEGDFKANFSGGGSVEKFELTPEIEWLAVESARAVGLDIAGVDILFDKSGYKICEVNGSPYFEGFEQATGINIPQEIFKYISLKMGN